MSGDLMYRQRETHRSNLHVPEEDTFPVRIKDIDVLRQTRTSKANASESTLNGIGTQKVLSRSLRNGFERQDSESREPSS